MTLREIVAKAPEITTQERNLLASFPVDFYTGMDKDDVKRLVIHRRAVHAGFYNEGGLDRYIRLVSGDQRTEAEGSQQRPTD